jgi:hypothetical protein
MIYITVSKPIIFFCILINSLECRKLLLQDECPDCLVAFLATCLKEYSQAQNPRSRVRTIKDIEKEIALLN